jgi:hypothetical protein
VVSTGARSTSRPVDDAEAALKTALDVLAGKDVPFLNYFDTPKITQDNMSEFTAGLLSLPGWNFFSGRGGAASSSC